LDAPDRDLAPHRLVWVFGGCSGLLIVGICLLSAAGLVVAGWMDGAAAGPGAEPPDPTMLAVDARVTERTAGSPVPVGASCRALVTWFGANVRYRCKADVTCSGHMLFGGEHKGFFHCSYDDGPPVALSGEDADATASDTDPAFHIDLTQRSFVVRDDHAGRFGAYALKARIDEVR
jgi:hypothetical protein